MPKRTYAMTPGKRQAYAKRFRARPYQPKRQVYRYQRRRAGLNQRVGGYLGIEYKFLDCAWNDVSIATSTDGSGGELQPSTGCTGAISVPAIGEGESDRDGRKYCIKSAWVSGMVNYTPAEDQANVQDISGTYFCLVLDTQANAATINSEDVFINPSSSLIAMGPQPLRNLQQSKRFRILASKWVQPSGSFAGTDGTNTNSVNAQVRMPVSLSWKGNIVVECKGDTANISSVSDNALHVLAFRTDNIVDQTFVGKSRLRFVG